MGTLFENKIGNYTPFYLVIMAIDLLKKVHKGKTRITAVADTTSSLLLAKQSLSFMATLIGYSL